MRIFYVPPDCCFFTTLVRGVRARVGVDKHVQCVVYSKSDEDNLTEAFNACEEVGMTVVNFACDDLGKNCSWPVDIQLKLASILSAASRQNNLSPRDAIALAPQLLKVALQCKVNSVLLNNLEEVIVGDAPKHIEDLVTYLPSAIQVLEESQAPGKIQPHTPILVLAPDQVSGSIVSQIKELMTTQTEARRLTTQELERQSVKLYDAYLVLKPIDTIMSEDCWNHIDDIHPSFQQKQLLEQLEIRRDQLQCLTKASEVGELVSMLFHPPNYVAKWFEMPVPPADNLQYAECRSIREEGMIALIKAKHMLTQTNKPVAIICDDDKMTKVLLSLSKLFGLSVAVPHGLPLRDAEHINFLELIFRAAYTNFEPAQLAALLRHKLWNEDTISLLETKYLRGLCRYDGLDELIALVREPLLAQQLHSFRAKFATLLALIKYETVEFSSLLSSVVNVAMDCSLEELAYDSLQTQNHNVRIAPSEFLGMLYSLIANHRTIPLAFQVPVVIIQSADSLSCIYHNIIITGLNEGTAGMDDGLLPAISKFIGIANVETFEQRRARHLFYLLHKPNVLLTRACMLSGSPQVPSRWLVRLKLLEKKAGFNLNAQPLIDEASSLYIPEEYIRYESPSPTPKLRLTKLSVTQVEQLMRDPYGVYAKQLLRLQPLDELDREPTQADFGQFVHACINAFSKNYDSSLTDQEHAREFSRYAEMMAARILRKPDARRLWMMRTDRIAQWIINFERTRQHKKIYTEVKGSMSIPLADGNEFMLTCVADRIEVNEDQVTIIDFKTGTLPTDKDVASYMSPQLPLEATILMHGGFESISSSLRLERLTYIKLGTGSEFGKTVDIKGDLQKIVEEAKRGLVALIEFYNNPSTPFAVAKFGKPSWYAHLARLDELRQW